MTIKESLSANIVLHQDYRKGTIEDQSSSDQTVAFNSAPYWGNSDRGKVLNFDSVDDSVEVTDSASLDVTTQLTISMWINPTDDDRSGIGLVEKYATVDDQRAFYFDFPSATNIRFQVSGDGTGGDTDSFSNASSIVLREWNHIVITYNAGAVNYYRNGVHIVTDTLTVTSINQSTANLVIGDRKNSAGLLYEGAIREVLLFNTELSEQQVSELYTESLQEAHLDTIPRATVLPESPELIASPVGSWNMNVKGDTVFDVSGNGNDGTIPKPLPSTAGIFGQALDFQGTTGEIEITDASAIQNIFDGGGSASFWCKPRSDGAVNRGHLFIKGSHNLSVRNEVSGFVKVLYEQVMSGTNGQWKTTGAEVALNTWNHIVFTYDADSASNDPIIYINGQSVPITEDSTPTGTRNTDVGDDLFIGNNTAETATFDGAIDQPQLWDTILTAAQATQLYAQGQKKLDLNFTGEDWNVSVSNVTANFLENTGFEITSGTWQVDDSSAGKQITCVGTGIISTPSQQAFGTWEFELSKDAASNPLIGFVMDSVQAGNAALGYQMTVTVDEAIFLRRITGGGSTTIFSTATGVLATDEFVRVVITRDASGTFEIFVNETSIDTGGDTAYVDSSFLVLQLDSGDAIRNIKFWPTVRDPTA